MADNGKNRTLTNESKEKIEEMKKRIHPFNPNGGGNTKIEKNIEDNELSLD